MRTFTPLEELENVLRYWWLVSLLAVLGGAAGLLVHSLRPPLYDAVARISISINFPEDYKLTQFEEDHAVNMAAGVIISTPVLEQVAEDARARGTPIDAPSLWSKLHLERRQEQWRLIIRDSDPQTATALANIFAERGLEALAEAHGHALEARLLERSAAGLEACLAGPEEGQPPPDLCGRMSLEEVREELQRVNAALQQEMLASQGVLPETVFSLTRNAELPDAPARYGRNTLVLAGGLIGFILGVLGVNLRLPARLVDYRLSRRTPRS